MKISQLFEQKQIFSLEVFPPKRDLSESTIYSTLDALGGISPDFISVTYGAGGTGSDNKAEKIASDIKNKYHTESVMHMPCIYMNEEDVMQLLEKLKQDGITNIMALRGDRVPDRDPANRFYYASDLIRFIRKSEYSSDFDITAACYPEGHNESRSLSDDIDNLKRKVDAGADHLITQLFFDNSYFYDFADRATAAGINLPIEAGIMPVLNSKQIARMVTLCGVSLPKKFVRVMEKYGDDPQRMADAGIAYAIDQIVDLAANDVDGIHLYTMNKPEVAIKIHQATKKLLR